MTPRKPAAAKSNSFITWFLSILTIVIVGVFGFLWNLNYQLGEMQATERARQEKVLDIQQTVSNIEEDVKDMKEKGIQDLKDRLKTLEIKNENNRK